MQQSVIIRWHIALCQIIVFAVNCLAHTEQSRTSPDRYEHAVTADFLQPINIVRHANQLQSNNSRWLASHGFDFDEILGARDDAVRPSQWIDRSGIELMRLRRDAGVNNLCKTQKCKCTSESNFMTVECPVLEVSLIEEICAIDLR